MQFSYYLLSIPAVLIALILHEVAHGYIAYKLGDPTARYMGRLTLNPLKHIDPVGALCMLFFHFGWAKPVPINTRYFKNPRRDMAITALAGPLTNLLIAFFSVPIFLLLNRAYATFLTTGNGSVFLGNLIFYTFYFFYLFHLINLGLGLFNLIPLPPLDGSRILYVFLPPRYYFGMMKYERYIALGLMLFLLLGNRLGFLSVASSFLSSAMKAVWQLIPGL